MEDEAFPDSGKPPEPSWLRIVRLVVMYLDFAFGAAGLVLGAVIGTLAFVRGAPQAFVGAFVLVVGGALLIVGGLALRHRHPLWWIPHLMLIVPILWDFLATRFR